MGGTIPTMWGRKKRAASGAGVSFDAFCGDAEAAALRSALEAGDWAAVADAYQQAGPHRREFLAQNLTLDRPYAEAIDAWSASQPDSAAALLFKGSQAISAAWEARGRGYAETVGDDAWEVFFGGLREAESYLVRSLSIDDDGVGWTILLTSGRGLQLSVDELLARYDRAVTATPDLAFAADQLHQALCEKWFGSHDQMFAFARQISADAPPGDPRHRLIAVSHFERALEFRDDRASRDAYRDDVEAQRELITAAENSVLRDDFGDSPQHVITLNWFALAFGYFNRADLAAPLFERIGDRPSLWPWSYFTTNAAKVFAAYRDDAGLSPLS